jgi:hypothetical protein
MRATLSANSTASVPTWIVDRQPNRPGEDLGALHATPRRAMHALPCTWRRGARTCVHSQSRLNWNTLLWLGRGTIFSNYVKTLAYQCQNRMGFLNYVKILAYYFFYWTVTLFGGHRFFTPLINIFLLSVESCACYLVVSILDQLFLEILTWTSYATSALQIKPHSDQIDLPQIVIREAANNSARTREQMWLTGHKIPHLTIICRCTRHQSKSPFTYF